MIEGEEVITLSYRPPVGTKTNGKAVFIVGEERPIASPFDFDNNQPLEGWNPVTGNWFVQNGRIEIQNTNLISTYAEVGLRPENNFTLEFDTTYTATQNNTGFLDGYKPEYESHVMFNAEDSNHLYQLDIRVIDDTPSLNLEVDLRRKDGSSSYTLLDNFSQTDAQTAFRLALGSALNTRIEYTNGAMEIFINDISLFTVTDDTYAPGKLALSTNKTDAYFDNFVLTEILAPVLPYDVIQLPDTRFRFMHQDTVAESDAQGQVRIEGRLYNVIYDDLTDEVALILASERSELVTEDIVFIKREGAPSESFFDFAIDGQFPPGWDDGGSSSYWRVENGQLVMDAGSTSTNNAILGPQTGDWFEYETVIEPGNQFNTLDIYLNYQDFSNNYKIS